MLSLCKLLDCSENFNYGIQPRLNHKCFIYIISKSNNLFKSIITSLQYIIIIIILFIVQCWTQASKPEPLKQDTQKGKNNRKENKFIFNTLK